jgi:5-methylcytosine-specific restriction protein A
VTDQSWFRQLLHKQGNFGVGLGVPIHSSDVIQELLRLTHAGTHDDRIAEEVSEQMYSDGRAIRVAVNRYERDREAREACLAAHGQICAVDLIHVDHLTPLSEVGPEYRVNAMTDLVPVCPNCHAVMHRTDPPLTPAQLRAEMGRSGSESS